jgi:hypothetical protein
MGGGELAVYSSGACTLVVCVLMCALLAHCLHAVIDAHQNRLGLEP